MDILDVLSNPTKEEWTELYDRKKEIFDNLQLDRGESSFNILDIFNAYYGIKLHSSIVEFNNRIFDLINNYIFLSYFYEKGIPDDEWYISPGKKGGAEYFPHFKEGDHLIHYWFMFYVESYYARFYGVLDHIYHMINYKYRMDVEPAMGFNNQVMRKLKRLEPNLHLYLEQLRDNENMVKINKFRNDFIHNLRPGQLELGIERRVNADGSKSFSSSVGKYTTASSFMENIEQSIDLLARTNEEIQGYISKDAN